MFHFTIRDVLWLTVVVAFAVMWWIESNRSERNYVTSQETRLREAELRGELAEENAELSD